MLKSCLNCGKDFIGKPKQACCSRKCSNELRNPSIYVKCEICGVDIRKTKSELSNSKHFYCSNECRAIGVGKFQSGENNPNFKNANTIVKCSNCNAPFKILNCNLKNSDGSIKKNHYCSQRCKASHQQTILLGEKNPKYRGGEVETTCGFCGKTFTIARYRDIMNEHNYCSQKCKGEHQKVILLGENNCNYIHGLSENYRIRYRIVDGYNTWRREVYERDGYACQCCGDKIGHNLNAHHINGYNWDKEHRTDIGNGITLCNECHKKFHNKYGNGNNTEQQFKQFKTEYTNPVVR